ESLVIVRGRETLELLNVCVLTLADLLLENGAVQLCLGVEVTKNDRFVDVRLGGKITRSRSAKTVSREHFHRCFQNVLPLAILRHGPPKVSTYLHPGGGFGKGKIKGHRGRGPFAPLPLQTYIVSGV